MDLFKPKIRASKRIRVTEIKEEDSSFKWKIIPLGIFFVILLNLYYFIHYQSEVYTKTEEEYNIEKLELEADILRIQEEIKEQTSQNELLDTIMQENDIKSKSYYKLMDELEDSSKTIRK